MVSLRNLTTTPNVTDKRTHDDTLEEKANTEGAIESTGVERDDRVSPVTQENLTA